MSVRKEFEKWVKNSKYRRLHAVSEGLSYGGASLLAAAIVYRWWFAFAFGAALIAVDFCTFEFLLRKYREHLVRRISKRLDLVE